MGIRFRERVVCRMPPLSGDLPDLQRSLLSKHGFRLPANAPALRFDGEAWAETDVVVLNGPLNPQAVAGLGLSFEAAVLDSIEITTADARTVFLEAPRIAIRRLKRSSVWTMPEDYPEGITFGPPGGLFTALRLTLGRGWTPVLSMADGDPVAARKGRYLVFGLDYGFFLRASSTFPDLTVGFANRIDRSRPDVFEQIVMEQIAAHCRRNGLALEPVPRWPGGKSGASQFGTTTTGCSRTTNSSVFCSSTTPAVSDRRGISSITNVSRIRLG
jgi:hypothetical protein